ncbi:UV radiation resistance protein and autophagy-related subunit 14-domain-containing protein [Cerioporus squamosus]|nr:UV radiation resistance protein and autophagy-related subunit 14-domain-containing protein [Cerioporus squamosus]
MQSTSLSSWFGSDADIAAYAASTLPRRIRHITSIQIRNLTPFPLRDAFASALTKPSEQSQFTPYGHLADDLDVTVGRKRGRRLSAAGSIHSGHRRDEDGLPESLDFSGEPSMRRRTSSRASIPLSTSAGSSSPRLTRRSSNVGSTSSIRPSQRSRTLSTASQLSHHTHTTSSVVSGELGPSTSSIFPDLLRDTSQKNLEKIVQSRLVETFVTITLLPSGTSSSNSRPSASTEESLDRLRGSSSSRPSSPSLLAKDKVSERDGSISKASSRRSTVGATTSPRSPITTARHAPSGSLSSAKSPLAGHGKSGSLSLANGRIPKSPSTTSPQKARFPTSSKTSQSISATSSLSETSPHKDAAAGSSDDTLPVPDYISPIHWPSTNPVFQLSKYEFAPGTDLSGARMRVEIWGRSSHEGASTFREKATSRQVPGGTADVKGKGKEQQADGTEADSVWKILESWDVVLSEMKPLPEELARNPAHIPFNSLLITLSTGEILYLPPRSLRSMSHSRAPSPSGYNSDPESEVHRTGTREADLQSSRLDLSFESLPTSPTTSELDGTYRRKRAVKSANWHDLLKLINLQTVILDTKQSLEEVVRQIDKAVVHNEAVILAREVSEREAWIAELQDERLTVDRESESLRNQISARREDLRRRRKLLEQARRLHQEDLSEEVRMDESISEERTRLSSLRTLLPIMRSNLISIVSFIYPIELVSPPDLLFSVLGVPLPIPVAATDPAPPLTLPNYKDVTEDSVATALGYSAQVVQLLSAYMGHRLVYPVTCVGSRSMIKDGISAMVGPRNFPLFSKGVDTYRFEYGVFLLNKDIEMLMSERNLRALDMRHTLPNLKNLLLTLTDNVQHPIPGHRVASSSVSISSLQSQSPVPAEASLAADTRPGTEAGAEPQGHVNNDKDGAATTASSSASALENGAGAGPSRSSTPPASGATTPTKASTQRKSRYLPDLAPLTGFLTLRGRYGAGQKPTLKAAAETPEEAQTSADGAAVGQAGEPGEEGAGGDDEDDRRTIRGVKTGGTVSGDEDVEEVVEGKVLANGHAKGGAANGREKVADAVAHPPSLVVSS